MESEAGEEGKYGDYSELPILFMQMPSNPDVGRFYAAIYQKLGVPLRTGHIRAAELESDILYFLKLLKVNMLVIDER